MSPGKQTLTIRVKQHRPVSRPHTLVTLFLSRHLPSTSRQRHGHVAVTSRNVTTMSWSCHHHVMFVITSRSRQRHVMVMLPPCHGHVTITSCLLSRHVMVTSASRHGCHNCDRCHFHRQCRYRVITFVVDVITVLVMI